MCSPVLLLLFVFLIRVLSDFILADVVIVVAVVIIVEAVAAGVVVVVVIVIVDICFFISFDVR